MGTYDSTYIKLERIHRQHYDLETEDDSTHTLLIYPAIEDARKRERQMAVNRWYGNGTYRDRSSLRVPRAGLAEFVELLSAFIGVWESGAATAKEILKEKERLR